MIYESRVKYSTLNPRNGKEEVVTETYIIPNAETFSDAENQTYTEMAKITPNTVIPAIKISDVDEILLDEGELFYKAKIGITDIDERDGKVKQIKKVLLIQSDGFNDAKVVADDWISGTISDCEILEIKKSSVMGVFEEVKTC